MLFYTKWLLAFLCLPLLLSAQFIDPFSDGNLTDNPTWMGNTNHFIINDQSQLQLMAPKAGNTLLYLPTAVADSATWEIYFHLDFSPSTSNSLQIILQSDQSDLLNGNGYYLMIGESGSDDAIRFYRMDNGIPNLLATASIGAVSDSPLVQLRIERKSGGAWQLLTDYTGGQNLQSEWSLIDTTYPGALDLFYGIHCQYTATRTDKFFFDNISLQAYTPDTLPPVMMEAVASSNTEINLVFNEPLDDLSATNPSNYHINNGIGQPLGVFQNNVDQTMVQLVLPSPLTNLEPYILTSENILDQYGNTAPTQTTTFSFFENPEPIAYDILINEIMADPTPVVALPPVEFIELYNRSSKSFNLESFQFSSGGAPQFLPDFLLEPGQYVIITDEIDVDSFSIFESVIGIPSFPSLTNSEDNLTLFDEAGNIIHFVKYTTSTYQDTQKDDGGWTLELINPSAPCKGMNNWKAANSLTGGSPGQANSVLEASPDTIGPRLLNVFSEKTSPTIITIDFNERMDSSQASLASNYLLPNGPLINHATIQSPDHTRVVLHLEEPLETSILYEVVVSESLSDCSGNRILDNKMGLALPSLIEPMDIVINEILFNPDAGCVDYVEVYNRSEKILNIGDLVLGNLVEGGDTIIKEIKTNKLVFPNEFVVLTEQPNTVRACHLAKNNDAFVQTDLPAFNNDTGNVTLFRTGPTGPVIIDAFHYNESYHHPLLDKVDGVSLERLSTEDLTQDRNNWQSAAAITGYGTPGYANSQTVDVANDGPHFFEIPVKVLSPDGDGHQDFLTLYYQADAAGYAAQIKLFDLEGRLVKTILNNELIGAQGFLRWDGDTDRGEQAPVGIYLLYAQVFLPNGTVKTFKETCAVVSRF